MWIRIRAVIVEDEPLAAQYLATLLDDTCQAEVVATPQRADHNCGNWDKNGLLPPASQTTHFELNEAQRI